PSTALRPGTPGLAAAVPACPARWVVASAIPGYVAGASGTGTASRLAPRVTAATRPVPSIEGRGAARRWNATPRAAHPRTSPLFRQEDATEGRGREVAGRHVVQHGRDDA